MEKRHMSAKLKKSKLKKTLYHFKQCDTESFFFIFKKSIAMDNKVVEYFVN